MVLEPLHKLLGIAGLQDRDVVTCDLFILENIDARGQRVGGYFSGWGLTGQ